MKGNVSKAVADASTYDRTLNGATALVNEKVKGVAEKSNAYTDKLLGSTTITLSSDSAELVDQLLHEEGVIKPEGMLGLEELAIQIRTGASGQVCLSDGVNRSSWFQFPEVRDEYSPANTIVISRTAEEHCTVRYLGAEGYIEYFIALPNDFVELMATATEVIYLFDDTESKITRLWYRCDAGSYARKALQQASAECEDEIKDAKKELRYEDTQILASAKGYADEKDTGVLEDAKNYASNVAYTKKHLPTECISGVDGAIWMWKFSTGPYSTQIIQELFYISGAREFYVTTKQNHFTSFLGETLVFYNPETAMNFTCVCTSYELVSESLYYYYFEILGGSLVASSTEEFVQAYTHFGEYGTYGWESKEDLLYDAKSHTDKLRNEAYIPKACTIADNAVFGYELCKKPIISTDNITDLNVVEGALKFDIVASSDVINYIVGRNLVFYNPATGDYFTCNCYDFSTVDATLRRYQMRGLSKPLDVSTLADFQKKYTFYGAYVGKYGWKSSSSVDKEYVDEQIAEVREDAEIKFSEAKAYTDSIISEAGVLAEKTIVLGNRLSYGAYELPADCVGIKSVTVEWDEKITSSDFAYVYLFDRKPPTYNVPEYAVASALYRYSEGLTKEITFEGFENRADIRYIYSYTDVGESGIVSIKYYTKTKYQEYTDNAIQQAILDSWEVGV